VKQRKVTLDASNQKNLQLWMDMIKDAVTVCTNVLTLPPAPLRSFASHSSRLQEAKTTNDDGDEDFDLFKSPGKAWTAREASMEDEKVRTNVPREFHTRSFTCLYSDDSERQRNVSKLERNWRS